MPGPPGWCHHSRLFLTVYPRPFAALCSTSAELAALPKLCLLGSSFAGSPICVRNSPHLAYRDTWTLRFYPGRWHRFGTDLSGTHWCPSRSEVLCSPSNTRSGKSPLCWHISQHVHTDCCLLQEKYIYASKPLLRAGKPQHSLLVMVFSSGHSFLASNTGERLFILLGKGYWRKQWQLLACQGQKEGMLSLPGTKGVTLLHITNDSS